MFKLFMGCFGNGTLICNSAVMENGDYKKIAHISNGGNITWYVPENEIPPDDLTIIKDTAKNAKSKFKKDFEQHDKTWQYYYMLNSFNIERVQYYLSDEYKNSKDFDHRLSEMRKYFYSIA